MRQLSSLLMAMILFLAACSSKTSKSLNQRGKESLPTSTLTVALTSTFRPSNTPEPTSTFTPFPTTTPIPSPTPDLKNLIVFVSDRNGSKEIYRMNSDGSDVIRLTNNAFEDDSPQWSHDKSIIAYTSRRTDGTYLIFIQPDGEELVSVKTDVWGDQCGWSPVELIFACLVYKSGDAKDLVFFNVESKESSIVYSSKSSLFDLDWSPDGKKIALASTTDSNGIVVYNTLDSYTDKFTIGEGYARDIAWSGKGDQIALSFGLRQQGVFADLYIVNSDGTDPRLLINEDGPVWVQSWSPSIDKILVVIMIKDSQIFIFNTVSYELIKLTGTDQGDDSSSFSNTSPVFSHDATKILYAAGRPGPSTDIYMMNSDGTGKVNLTNHPARDTSPDW